jgi:hypothetical protein
MVQKVEPSDFYCQNKFNYRYQKLAQVDSCGNQKTFHLESFETFIKLKGDFRGGHGLKQSFANYKIFSTKQ